MSQTQKKFIFTFPLSYLTQTPRPPSVSNHTNNVILSRTRTSFKSIQRFFFGFFLTFEKWVVVNLLLFRVFVSCTRESFSSPILLTEFTNGLFNVLSLKLETSTYFCR